MRIGKDKNPQPYYMNERPLNHIKEEKDLGAVVDNRLKFLAHVASAVKHANKVLGLIKHLEYGSIILGPQFKEVMKAVEKS